MLPVWRHLYGLAKHVPGGYGTLFSFGLCASLYAIFVSPHIDDLQLARDQALQAAEESVGRLDHERLKLERCAEMRVSMASACVEVSTILNRLGVRSDD